MGTPLTLSSVPAQTPYIQYVATGGQTVFPYPFEITQDSDLVCVVNGVTQATDAGYTLSGQGNSTGGNLTFTVGRSANDVVTLFRNIAIQRISQIAQNSGFSSTVFNAEYNQIYLILQQLATSVGLCLQVPNTNNPAPTTVLTPGAYANKYLAFDSNGNPTPALLTSSGSLTLAILAGLLNPQTTNEANAGVTPTSLQYLPGNVLRYGADPTGSSSSNAAFQAAYNQAVQGTTHSDVYAPAGTYKILSPGLSFTNQANIRIFGDGPVQTTLKLSGSNYTILTVSADTGGGTTGTNLILEDFGIDGYNGGAGTGVSALAIADYQQFQLNNLQLFSSGNSLKMGGMALGTVNNVYGLTGGTNAAGNAALLLTVDSSATGFGNGPIVFNGCTFNGGGNVTAGAAVWSQKSFSMVFNSCMFIGVGSALTSVLEITNNDDMTFNGCYSESSRNTSGNTGTLFSLGATNAPQNVTIIGGTYFVGNGVTALQYSINAPKVQALTVENATFAGNATSAIKYVLSAASLVKIDNVYSSGSANPPVLDSSVGGPASAYLTGWRDPRPFLDVSLTNTAASVTGDGTVYTVLFDTTNFDHLSMYSAGTGKVTIPPQKGGLYQVTACVSVNSLTSSYTGMEVDIVQKTTGGSGVSTHSAITNPGAIKNASNQAQVTVTALLVCTGGDVITVTVAVSGSTKSVGVLGATPNEYTYLSVRQVL